MATKFRMSLINLLFSAVVLAILLALDAGLAYAALFRPTALSNMGTGTRVAFAWVSLIALFLVILLFYRVEVAEGSLTIRTLFVWRQISVKQIRSISRIGGIVSVYVLQREREDGSIRPIWMFCVAHEEQFFFALKNANPNLGASG